jgi:hypothetical protein
MLAGHPRLWAPPEMLLAPFATMAEREAYLAKRYWEKGGLRRGLMDLRGLSVDDAKAAVSALADRTIPTVYAHLQELAGGRMIVDKCPHLSILPKDVFERAMSWFPEVRVVWIVRHPGSVIRSAANMPMAEVMAEGYGQIDVESLWSRGNAMIRDFVATLPKDRWTRIRYEDLVSSPEPALRRVCDAIGVPFHEAVLDPYEGDRMREGPKGARAIGDSNMVARKRIQPELATAWLESFDTSTLRDETRALATELGYDMTVTGKTPMARLGDMLSAFWDAARDLERKIDLPMDLDAVEGRRFLLRMMSASIDTFVEHSNVDHPRFHHAEGPTRKMFADCPDTDYLRAPIRTGPGRVYRVSGRVPKGTAYAGVLLYGKGGRVGSRLRDDELRISDDGSFELRISTEEQPGVWLRADGDETAVMVRQYFTDRAKEEPIEVHVELERPKPGPPAPLAPGAMIEEVDRATRMIRSVFERTLGAYRMATSAGLNRFFEIGGEQLFPTPDNVYQVTWYRFAPGQIMLVRGRVPKARYYSFTLCNAWMESFDYERHRCVLNHTQLRTEPDGSFEVCLANEDPGHPNWLDVAGHHAGYAIVRALLPEEPSPPLSTQILFVDEWKAERDRVSSTPA